MKSIALVMIGLISVSCTVFPANYNILSDAILQGCELSLPEEGMCAANWAIVIANVLAINKCLVSKTQVPLSSQYLLDCTPTNEASPCDGNLQPETFFNALEFKNEANGTKDFSCQPSFSQMSGYKGNCTDSCYKTYAVENSTDFSTKGDYKNMTKIEDVKQSLLVENSLVIAMIDVTIDMLFGPKTSVVHDPHYEALGLRAFMIVGWSTDDKGTCQYTVQNTWGPGWANSGYGYIACDSPTLKYLVQVKPL